MSKQTPHFFVMALPAKEDRCANAVYFLREALGVDMYVTDSRKNIFLIAGDADSIANIQSPNGTIEVNLNGEVVELEVSSSILDDIEALKNAIIQPPNYVPPSSTVDFGNPTVVEAGTNLSRILSTNFFRNDAGEVTNIKLFRDSTIIADTDTNQNVLAGGDSFIIGRETVTHSSEITYEQGGLKQNNIGEEDSTGRIQAGTITSNKNIVGRYNIFFGSSTSFFTQGADIRQDLSSVFENSNSFSFNANQRFMTIAIPQVINTNSIKITTSNNETLTQNFLDNQRTLTITDADFNPVTYNLLEYSTAIPLEVTVNVTL
jgi:hypothetical protein